MRAARALWALWSVQRAAAVAASSPRGQGRAVAAAAAADTPTTAEDNCGPPPRNRQPRPVAVAIARLRGRLIVAVARGGVGSILVAQKVRCQPTGCKVHLGVGNFAHEKPTAKCEERFSKLNSGPIFRCEAGAGARGNVAMCTDSSMIRSFFVLRAPLSWL